MSTFTPPPPKVACIQFINIVVHSPENINLRVYLQYAFTLLGLDDFLRVSHSVPIHVYYALSYQPIDATL